MLYLGNLHKGQEHTLRHGVVIRCDRGHSVLCNPFKVTSEDQRDHSCDQYQAYFDKKVREKTDTAFMNELRRIYRLALTTDVVLACWCYPKRCHTQTIKNFLEQYLKRDKRYTSTPRPKPNLSLYADEQTRLDYLIRKGCDAKKRKACAYLFIHRWHYLITGEMSARQFVEAQRRYCLAHYSQRFANSFAYKAVCVLDQVKSIEKRFYRYFESDGTIALSGLYNPQDAGMRYHPYLAIHWKDEKPEHRTTQAEIHALQHQADESLPEELKSTNMHLYREGREDHSWLDGIQTERAQQEEQTRNTQLLQQLKDKYTKIRAKHKHTQSNHT